MTPVELLRMCVNKLELQADTEHPLHDILQKTEPGLTLWHPRGCGRFPFTGGGTELLSATDAGTNYHVPVSRVLSGLAKGLKAMYP